MPSTSINVYYIFCTYTCICIYCEYCIYASACFIYINKNEYVEPFVRKNLPLLELYTLDLKQ